MVTEGSLYSATKTGATINVYAKNSNDILKRPLHQLYINGLVISKNTVAGSLQTPPQCPVLTPCNTSGTNGDVQQYDMSYFRNYEHGQQGRLPAIPTFRTSLATQNPKIQEASVIIDYNTNILSDPPP